MFGEVGYGMTFNQVAVEPLAGLAYVHLHNGAFLESGGVAALSGSSVNENIGYSSLGVRAATALPLANGTVLGAARLAAMAARLRRCDPGRGLGLPGHGRCVLGRGRADRARHRAH